MASPLAETIGTAERRGDRDPSEDRETDEPEEAPDGDSLDDIIEAYARR